MSNAASISLVPPIACPAIGDKAKPYAGRLARERPLADSGIVIIGAARPKRKLTEFAKIASSPELSTTRQCVVEILRSSLTRCQLRYKACSAARQDATITMNNRPASSTRSRRPCSKCRACPLPEIAGDIRFHARTDPQTVRCRAQTHSMPQMPNRRGNIGQIRGGKLSKYVRKQRSNDRKGIP